MTPEKKASFSVSSTYASSASYSIVSLFQVTFLAKISLGSHAPVFSPVLFTSRGKSPINRFPLLSNTTGDWPIVARELRSNTCRGTMKFMAAVTNDAVRHSARNNSADCRFLSFRGIVSAAGWFQNFSHVRREISFGKDDNHKCVSSISTIAAIFREVKIATRSSSSIRLFPVPHRRHSFPWKTSPAGPGGLPWPIFESSGNKVGEQRERWKRRRHCWLHLAILSLGFMQGNGLSECTSTVTVRFLLAGVCTTCATDTCAHWRPG